MRPWIRPWNAEYAAGRITRPLRHNGTAYSGINILMLWGAAAQGFTAPVWMTFKQAMEVGAHVRKGEKGSLVVYVPISDTSFCYPRPTITPKPPQNERSLADAITMQTV